MQLLSNECRGRSVRYDLAVTESCHLLVIVTVFSERGVFFNGLDSIVGLMGHILCRITRAGRPTSILLIIFDPDNMQERGYTTYKTKRELDLIIEATTMMFFLEKKRLKLLLSLTIISIMMIVTTRTMYKTHWSFFFLLV